MQLRRIFRQLVVGVEHAERLVGDTTDRRNPKLRRVLPEESTHPLRLHRHRGSLRPDLCAGGVDQRPYGFGGNGLM